jgi:hypothetical protein
MSVIQHRDPDNFDQFPLPPNYNEGFAMSEKNKYKQYTEIRLINITAEQEFDLCE